MRATGHDDAPADDRHVREVLRLTSCTSRIHIAVCVASLSCLLTRTRDYVVAAKCLALFHRLVADDDPHFRHEIARASTAGRRGGAPVLAVLADFRDEAHSASWDHLAFVRAYALYLDDRVRFLLALLPPPRTVRFADGYAYADCPIGVSPFPAPDMTVSVHDMDPVSTSITPETR